MSLDLVLEKVDKVRLLVELSGDIFNGPDSLAKAEVFSKLLENPNDVPEKVWKRPLIYCYFANFAGTFKYF